MQFTEKQKQAIHTPGKSVLVSAAAGSGKTSVLAKRVARLIADGADVRRMLIMTFTNAAAAEMRQRIARELAAAAREAADERLLMQAEYVSIADISTFHSFCGKVVRQNYPVLGVSPSFRIADSNEAAGLRGETVRELFDELYEKEDADFLRLLARYTTRANDARLAEYLFDIYNYMMSKPDPFLWTERSLHKESEEYIAMLRRGLEQALLEKLGEGERLMEAAAEFSSHYDGGQQQKDEACAELFREMLACAQEEGLAAMAGRYTSMGVKLPALTRGLEQEHKEKLSILYKAARANLKEVTGDCVLLDFEQTAREEARHTQQDVSALISLVRAFYAAYTEKKADANVLDYEDLQHYALRALGDEAVRTSFAGQYDHVFVDEYQDTNPVQEEIVRAVSGNGSLFMVGDIKQSIYKFRLADPMIFKQKAQEFKSGAGENEIILMNDNFRSARHVIESVNFVMDCVMSERTGEIVYDEGEKLVGNLGGGHAEVLLSCPPEGEDKNAAQAAMLARSIGQQLGREITDPRTGEKRRARYGDIAVLMRSRSDLIPALKSEFDHRCIPCVIDMEQARDFKEIELFVNLLRLVDNRKQDVPLLSVMRSYLGGFTEEDFAQIRLCRNDRKIPFYEAAEAYAREREDELKKRLDDFYAQLEGLRLYAGAFSLREFLMAAVRVTDFDTYLSCVPGGATKRRAFSQFMDTACSLAQTSGDSLYLLLRALRELKKRDGAYVSASVPAEDADCVRIMTIHGSKGLEFPIVYLARLEASLKPKELDKSVLLHSEYGLAVKYVDEQDFVRRDTIETRLLKERLAQEYKSEELRILYVGMTRARDALFLAAGVKDIEKQRATWELMRELGNYQDAKCMLDWVMAVPEGGPMKVTVDDGGREGEESAAQQGRFDYEAFRQDLLARVKPAELLRITRREGIPAKVSVSAVKRALAGDKKPIRAFLKAEPQETDEAEITGAQLGTLVHSVMERLTCGADLAQATDEMLRSQVITPQEGEAILENRALAEGFLNSPVYRRMTQARRVLREQPFNLRVEAEGAGYEGPGHMLVQGVLDLAFLEDDGWVLVDYKTDRVSENTAPAAAEGYAAQLGLYARALADITGIPVKERYLYFMRLQKCVEV